MEQVRVAVIETWLRYFWRILNFVEKSKCDLQITYLGKALPLQAWSGPEGYRKLRFPDFMTTAQDGGRLSALRTGRL